METMIADSLRLLSGTITQFLCAVMSKPDVSCNEERRNTVSSVRYKAALKLSRKILNKNIFSLDLAKWRNLFRLLTNICINNNTLITVWGWIMLSSLPSASSFTASPVWGLKKLQLMQILALSFLLPFLYVCICISSTSVYLFVSMYVCGYTSIYGKSMWKRSLLSPFSCERMLDEDRLGKQWAISKTPS